LNFKSYQQTQDYISQPCIKPGDVRCWIYARLGNVVLSYLEGLEIQGLYRNLSLLD
jgi:hypothetical protein